MYLLEIYHATFDWPNSADIEERLQKVEDNTEADVMNRLIHYHRHITGLKALYEPVSKVINADQPKMDVFAQGTIINIICCCNFIILIYFFKLCYYDTYLYRKYVLHYLTGK